MKDTNLIRTSGNIADKMKKQRNQLKTKTEEKADYRNVRLFFRYLISVNINQYLISL